MPVFVKTDKYLRICARLMFVLDPEDPRTLEERNARDRMILTCVEILEAIGVTINFQEV